MSSIPIAPGCVTDPPELNYSVHDKYSVKKYNLSSGQCKLADKFAKLWDTIPECLQNASSGEIFKYIF